jgi:hypothetical protein
MTRAALALAVGLSLVSACSKKPSRSDCEKLLSHVVDLELASGNAKLDPKTVADQHKKVSDYVSKDFLQSCKKDLPYDQVDCALKATTLEELSACDKS